MIQIVLYFDEYLLIYTSVFRMLYTQYKFWYFLHTKVLLLDLYIVITKETRYIV